MKNEYKTVLRCDECLSHNIFYDKETFNEANFTLNYINLGDPFILKCKFCGKINQVHKKNIVINEKYEAKYKKMKIERGEEGGNFLRNTDIGDGDIGDKDTVEIIGEGEIKSGQYGERLQLPIMVGEEEKLFSVSNKNRNVIIDLYGDETEEWVDKDITVMVESCDVGKTGTQLTVLKPKKKKK